MFHQQKSHMENMLYLLIFVTENTWTVAISVECLISCEKQENIQMILQLSECLSVTNIGAILFVCNTTVILARLISLLLLFLFRSLD